MIEPSPFLCFYRHKATWLIEHVLFAGIPICLAITTFAHRPFIQYLLLVLTAGYMAIMARVVRAGRMDLGLTIDNFARHLGQMAPVTMVMAAVILIGRYTGLIHPSAQSGASQAIAYVLISIPLQEIVFCSFCLWRCRLTWRSTWFIILFASADFAFFHLVYGSWELVAGAFLASIVWSWYFLRQHDILAVGISHAIVGLCYFL